MSRTSTHTARRLSALAVPLLLAASLTACGDDDGKGSPDDASKEDFCKVYNADGEEDAFDGEGTPKEQAKKIVDALEKATDKLADTGTPKDIPDDAREGFEVFVDTIGDLDEDDVEKAIESNDPEALQGSLDKGDEDKIDAFNTWAGDYCG